MGVFFLVAMGGAVLVIHGIWADVGAILIAAYLVPVTIVMHPFWTFEDSRQVKEHRDSFLLNTSVLGGSLILFWAINHSQHVPAALHLHATVRPLVRSRRWRRACSRTRPFT
jgi:putative oxidoreductase